MITRPQSVCYHDRTAAVEKFGLKRYQRDSKFISQSQLDSATPVIHDLSQKRKTGISASLRSLNSKIHRRSFDAFRQFFKTKMNRKTPVKKKVFKRRESNLSIEFWEEDYTTIRRIPKLSTQKISLYRNKTAKIRVRLKPRHQKEFNYRWGL